ncbi:MAG: dual specificity protein phosphatase family protein [Desulfobacterales bacterium]|nr:dual specificity protein phosphatase family protein [Desulfobacterales bacterium]
MIGHLKLILLIGLCSVLQGTVRPESWAKRIELPHVENLYRVDEGLYRSAQPDTDGFLELKKFGITQVLNLRDFFDDADETKGMGLKLYSVEMNAWNIRDQDVIAALKIISDKQNRPLLVHCKHGADRTGTIIAMYRIVIQGWTKKEALNELIDGGFGYHTIWKNIPEYIKTVDIEKIKKNLQ